LELSQYLIKRITNECELIIFDGNHDININNDKRMSSIDATIKYMKTKNEIHYLTENDIYEIHNINFGLVTMYSNNVPEIQEDNLNIALHHGTLYKSLTDLNHTFDNEDSLKCQDFENYDLVLLGDIHLQQYLNSKKTIAYSGSLIQQNYGESNNKGYLKWDISDRKNITSSYKLINNDYLFKTIYIDENNKFDLNKFDEIKEKYIRLRIQYKNLNKEELLERQKILQTAAEVLVKRKEEISDILTKTGEANILNKNFLDIYKDFIKEKDIEENKDVTNKIDQIIKDFNIEDNNITKDIKIKELEFENLFSYGSDNKINFESIHGINIILGKTFKVIKITLINLIFTLYDNFSILSKGSG
jgi:DNA repair exonuclease SbcCD nuclease subunit